MKITYSPEHPGCDGNHNQPVRFDNTVGYIGINQRKGDGLDRVLLSPAQVKALLKFLGVRRGK